MVAPIPRRLALSLIAGAGLLPVRALGETVIDLDWADLLPPGAPEVAPVLQSLLDHDGPAAMAASQPASSGVRHDWDGRIVRLPGFIVPLEFAGTAVSAFILVPYVGACIHVPPPPANQLVHVTTDTPFESRSLFEAVNVTGTFRATDTATDLAAIGYAITAETIERYRG